MGALSLFIVALVVASFQGWFASALSIGWLVPNLVLILVILVTLNRGLRLALAVAIFAGLILDLASLSHFGVNILTYIVVVFALNLVQKMGLDFSFRPALIGFTFLANIIISGSKILLLLGEPIGWSGLGSIIWLWILYAAVTSLAMLLFGEHFAKLLKNQDSVLPRRPN